MLATPGNTTFIINRALLVLGFIFLGKSFGIKTVYVQCADVGWVKCGENGSQCLRHSPHSRRETDLCGSCFQRRVQPSYLMSELPVRGTLYYRQ